MKIFAAIIFLLLKTSISFCSELEIVCEWKLIDYKFPTAADREYAIENQLFIPENVVPIDVDAHYEGNFRSTAHVTCFLLFKF